LQGLDVYSKKLPAVAALQVVSAAVFSDQYDATSFKSANVQLSSNQTLIANIKSSGECTTGHVGKHVAPSSLHTLNGQPTLPLSKVSDQTASFGVTRPTDSFVSASPSSQPSSQVESFSQPMWSKTGLIAVVEVPLHQHA
jgi:hypothetical protein